MRNASYYATEPQKAYLRRLAEQCFTGGLEVGYDMRAALASGRMSKAEASREIERLKALLGQK